MTERLFKVLSPKAEAWHGGVGSWHKPVGKRPGKWMPTIDSIKPCARGYHLCREGDLVYWLGPVIYEVEYRGDRVDVNNKIVVASARLVRRLDTWNERTARLFAADCAEAVLHHYEDRHDNPAPRRAIEAARAFARGEIDSAACSAACSAARSAADSAAYSAARSAADSAADAAARSAADSAAYSAACSAAHSAADAAARSAAYSAAYSAARSAQTARLFDYLDGRVA